MPTYTVTTPGRDGVTFNDPVLAAQEFHNAPAEASPYVIRVVEKHGRQSGAMIANTSRVTSTGVTRFGKWAGSSDPEFEAAFNKLRIS